MSLWQKQLLPHGTWQKVSNQLWLLSGTLPRGNMPRTMAVYRKSNGGLIIHSGITMDDATINELLSWGKPEILVVPNPWHRLDAAAFKERFPELKVTTPRDAMSKVAEKLKVDACAEDMLPGTGFEPCVIDGVKRIELCYEAALENRKGLIFTDALMNLPHLPGFGGWLFRVLGSTGFFGMTRIGRMILLRDRKLFQNWLRSRAEDTKIKVIAVAHGEAIVGEKCIAALKSAADRLDD